MKLAEALRSEAQNEHMVDWRYTRAGQLLNAAADALDAIEANLHRADEVLDREVKS